MILVTGAAGFLGREVVHQLAERGRAVRGVDLLPGPASAPAGRRLDLLDAQAVSAALEGVTAVVHCAAVQFHTPGRPRFRIEPFFRRNVTMTEHLLAAAAAARVVRFVFVSSDMVYGPPERGALREDGPTRPLGPYGRSKLACEELCRAALGGVAQVVILRPSVIIGPGRRGLMESLFARIRSHQPLVILGDGHNRHHMVAVSDAARACLLALETPTPGTFNIASDDPPTMRELLTEVARRARSRSRVVSVPVKPAWLALDLLWSLRLSPVNPEQYRIAPLDYVLDTAAAHSGLGFQPRHHDTDAMFEAYRGYAASRGE